MKNRAEKVFKAIAPPCSFHSSLSASESVVTCVPLTGLREAVVTMRAMRTMRTMRTMMKLLDHDEIAAIWEAVPPIT